VLETMFFSAPMGLAELETEAGVVEARMAFHGRPSGLVGVRVPGESARLLAAGFLGEDENMLTESQPGQAVCELANMLCGSLLRTLEGGEAFELAPPELMPAAGAIPGVPGPPPDASRSFRIENGVLTVTLHLEAVT